MTMIEEAAPAKINLTLEVLGRRPDGYHELRSLVAFARDAADLVTLDVSRSPSCEVTGPFGGSIAGQNLIAVTLAKLSAADAGLKLGHVTLTKNLPVAAGIGGGSADAAAVLRAVARANPERVDRIDWNAIALAIGSDVPVCFQGRLSWMMGVGETVAPVAIGLVSHLHVVVANPRVAVPDDKTAQVYRALRAQPLAPTFARQMPLGAASADDLFALVASGHNALEQAAIEIVPEIATVLSELAALPGVRISRMSGGGPTCFAIFDRANAATAAAATLCAKRPSWWVTASALA